MEFMELNMLYPIKSDQVTKQIVEQTTKSSTVSTSPFTRGISYGPARS